MGLVAKIVVAAAVFGLATADFAAPKWAAMQIGLFALPVAALVLRNETLRIFAAWTAVFLVLQALLSPLVLDRDLKTLPPNMRQVIDPGRELPGITGQQVITTDSLGFRTTRTVDYAQGDGVRIFAIGGSTTEQIYLDDRRTWTHLLQETLANERPGVEVVNTGVSGLRARHHVATLKRIATLNPDIVLLLVGINDWNHEIAAHTEAQERGQSALGNFGAAIGGWRAPLVERFSLEGSLLAAPLKIATRLVSGGGEGQTSGNPPSFTGARASLERARKLVYKPATVDSGYAAALEAFGEECQRQKITCVLVTQPNGYQKGASEEFKKGFWMTPPFQDYTLDFDSMVAIADVYNRHLADFTSRNGLTLCDAAALFPPTVESFYDDCHFNTSGARKMSEVLAKCLAPIK